MMLARAASLLLSLLLLSPPAAPASDEFHRLEEQVKATFLFRFLDYVEWPADGAREPGVGITVGVLGSDEIASVLHHYAVEARRSGPLITVRRLREGDPLDGLQMLYIDRSQRARSAELARASHHRGLLVVTDWHGALDLGAAINFVPVGTRIRFDVSVPAADRAGIRLSARLLAVANHVRTGLQ
jgi:hypothetical protein